MPKFSKGFIRSEALTCSLTKCNYSVTGGHLFLPCGFLLFKKSGSATLSRTPTDSCNDRLICSILLNRSLRPCLLQTLFRYSQR